MNAVIIKRTFLTRPTNSLGMLIGVALFFEGFSWATAFSFKVARVHALGGIASYTGMWLKNILLPEACTLLILYASINVYHKLLRLNTVDLTWRSILRYQLAVLPVFCIAFFIFNPFTQTVRFILETFPNYSGRNYWHDAILNTYTFRMYILYLMPITLLGYLAVNTSLFMDYLAQRSEEEAMISIETLSSIPIVTPNSAPEPAFLTLLKGRNTQHGETLLMTTECTCFLKEDRTYYAVQEKGRYVITKNLNELEAELDPIQFFRVNRGVIVNRSTVLGISHWKQGKYIVNLQSPCFNSLVLPRTRMAEFKAWMAGQPASPLPSRNGFDDDSGFDELPNKTAIGLQMMPDMQAVMN